MILERGSDLVLKIKDERGNGIRVANKASFFIKVYTTDKNRSLVYDRDSIVERGNYDTLYISADELATLESGVIIYTYGWGIADDRFEDGEYNRLNTIYTDYYFKNDGEATVPATPEIINSLQQKIDELNQRLQWVEIPG